MAERLKNCNNLDASVEELAQALVLKARKDSTPAPVRKYPASIILPHRGVRYNTEVYSKNKEEAAHYTGVEPYGEKFRAIYTSTRGRTVVGKIFDTAKDASKAYQEYVSTRVK